MNTYIVFFFELLSLPECFASETTDIHSLFQVLSANNTSRLLTALTQIHFVSRAQPKSLNTLQVELNIDRNKICCLHLKREKHIILLLHR